MAYPHPQYDNLVIYEDLPRPGAFYQVTRNDGSLSSLAKKAYGSGTIQWWSLINKSQYNSKFIRRADSGSCKSAKVVYPKGYIAMCKPYPLLWIPTREGDEPGAVAGPNPPPITSEVQNLGEPNATMRVAKMPPGVLSAYSPKLTSAASKIALNMRTSEAMMQSIESPSIPPDLAKAGIPSWVGSFLLVAGISVAGIIFAQKVSAA